MKRVVTVLTILFVFTISAFAEMSTGKGDGMMRGGWWWGVNSVWYYSTIIAILIIFGVFSILKQR